MILSDTTLRPRLREFIPEGFDEALINPASIDIRIGRSLILETREKWEQFDLEGPQEAFMLPPGGFCLVPTYEVLRVPNGYAVEMKLKSSRAREGYNHSLAFWFDPGWHGIGTMEISNLLRFRSLPLYCGMRFAQIIVHRLDSDATKPYEGRYNGARDVEMSKA